jgi:uncharacterized protein YdaU (DUF1376 family)
MAEFPAMPLWTDAYLGDTTHLTTLEHGAYLLLLMTAWRSREHTLPDDDRLLARYAKMTPAQWQRVKPILAEFFTISNGRWAQRRLLDEANAVKQFREKQRAAGKASALKRKGRHSATVETGSDQNQPPTPTPTPNEEPKGSLPPTPKHTRKADWPEIPDWVPVEPWNAFVQMRKDKRAPLTARAVKLTLRDLEKWMHTGQDPGAILDKSTQHCWTGIFELKDDRRGTGNFSGQSAVDPRDGFTRSLHDDLYAHHAQGAAE